MEKNWLNIGSTEQPVQEATKAAGLPGGNDPGEIVIYDECGDTLWDKVLAQDARQNPPKQ